MDWIKNHDYKLMESGSEMNRSTNFLTKSTHETYVWIQKDFIFAAMQCNAGNTKR